ncbi:MAG: glycoside hydrolase family 16 protein [Bacteroidales bacterium]|nr:glycoside hydrolase family 16 protein [Bacteroidales bacterium]
MKKTFAIFFLVVCALSIKCQTPNKSPTRWTKINSLSDDFNNSTLNTSLWESDNSSDNTCVTSFSSNNVYFETSAFTSDKVMKIKTKKLASSIVKACNGNDVTFNLESGLIRSKELYQYGYYEINAKIPNTTHSVGSSFWLWYSDFCHTDETIYLEIDIFENLSNFPNNHVSHIHKGCCGCDEYSYDYNFQTCPGYRCSCVGEENSNLGYDQSLGFHKYGLDWQQNYIDFYVDDKLIYHVASLPRHNTQCPTSTTSSISVNELDYLPLRVILDGVVRSYEHYHSSTDCDYNEISYPTTSGDIFEVDYFHYYKRNPEIIDVKTDFSTYQTEITFSSGIKDDEYSHSIIPSGSSTIYLYNDKAKISFNSSSVTHITVNATQKTPQQWYNTNYECKNCTTGNMYNCPSITIKDTPNFNTVISTSDFDIQYSSNLYLNSYNTNTVYIANTITTPYYQDSAIISNADIIFNVKDYVYFNYGFEVQLGASLYVNPINN